MLCNTELTIIGAVLAVVRYLLSLPDIATNDLSTFRASNVSHPNQQHLSSVLEDLVTDRTLTVAREALVVDVQSEQLKEPASLKYGDNVRFPAMLVRLCVRSMTDGLGSMG